MAGLDSLCEKLYHLSLCEVSQANILSMALFATQNSLESRNELVNLAL